MFDFFADFVNSGDDKGHVWEGTPKLAFCETDNPLNKNKDSTIFETIQLL